MAEATETAPLMTEAQVSRVLQVDALTIANWRCTNRVAGLPYVKIGGAVRYRRQDVDAFIAANLRGTDSTGAAK